MGNIKSKCQICGGDIRNGRCRECGMPYRDDAKMYRLNETLSAAQKEAQQSGKKQVTKSKPQPERTTTSQKQQRQYQRTWAAGGSAQKRIMNIAAARQKEKNPNAKTKALVVCGGIVLLLWVIAMLQDYTFRSEREVSYETAVNTVENQGDITVDPEEYPEDLPALPETGEEFTAELEAGTYRVGWQIPEGVYTVSAGGKESSQISVADEKHMIWIYQSMTQDREGYGASSISDVRLYQGAEVMIEGSDPLTLHSTCANTESQAAAAENPLTQSFTLNISGKSMRDDIPSGYYDLSAKKGWGPITVRRGEEEITSVFMGAYSGNSRIYRNFFVPEGAAVYLEEEYSDDTLEVEFTPSAFIYE